MYQQKRWNKYNAVKAQYKGGLYASKFEAQYAMMLDQKQQEGEVVSWEKQISLDLKVNGFHITTYKIDFIVKYADGHYEWVETKGMETDSWRMKWRLLEALFSDFKRSPDDVMVLVKQTGIRYFKPKVKK